MYAVIETGGKQYRVQKGDIIHVEKLGGNAGDSLTFENILLIGGAEALKLGRPHVAGAKVAATIEDQMRAKKIVVYKKKRRKGYEVRRGHRQYQTRVKITSIDV